MKPQWIWGMVLFNLVPLISGMAFAGQCVINGPRYKLTSDAVGWTMRIGSGQTCVYGLRYNAVAMERVALASSPQYGEVELQGPGFMYTAKSDFQGEDFFALVVSGAIMSIPGSSIIKINVAVVGEPTKGVPEEATQLQKLAIQIAEQDDKLMNLALNNAKNVIEYYKSGGETVTVEIVAFGPGLHMLRADTSPVKDRIAAMALEYPELSFMGCNETQMYMSKAESKPISLISEARTTKSGVVRLIELKEQGYVYIRP